jgi:hypothetical protein
LVPNQLFLLSFCALTVFHHSKPRTPVHARSKELTEPEIQALLFEETPNPDEELSELTLMDAYQFSDGRILFLFDGEPPTGTLWPSRESVLESLNPDEAEPGHILEGRLPQGQSFPGQVPQLTATLAELVELPVDVLDYSVESLKPLDQRVKERYKPAERLGTAIFPCLIAYLGEVVRLRVDGTWEMRQSGHANVWEPWVRSPDGREFAPFVCIYDQLINHTDPAARLERAVPVWARDE